MSEEHPASPDGGGVSPSTSVFPAPDTDQCPACGNPAESRCRCFLGDRACRFGHEWHVCPVCQARTEGAGNHKVDHDHRDNWCRKCLDQTKAT